MSGGLRVLGSKEILDNPFSELDDFIFINRIDRNNAILTDLIQELNTLTCKPNRKLNDKEIELVNLSDISRQVDKIAKRIFLFALQVSDEKFAEVKNLFNGFSEYREKFVLIENERNKLKVFKEHETIPRLITTILSDIADFFERTTPENESGSLIASLKARISQQTDFLISLARSATADDFDSIENLINICFSKASQARIAEVKKQRDQPPLEQFYARLLEIQQEKEQLVFYPWESYGLCGAISRHKDQVNLAELFCQMIGIIENSQDVPQEQKELWSPKRGPLMAILKQKMSPSVTKLAKANTETLKKASKGWKQGWDEKTANSIYNLLLREAYEPVRTNPILCRLLKTLEQEPGKLTLEERKKTLEYLKLAVSHSSHQIYRSYQLSLSKKTNEQFDVIKKLIEECSQLTSHSLIQNCLNIFLKLNQASPEVEPPNWKEMLKQGNLCKILNREMDECWWTATLTNPKTGKQEHFLIKELSGTRSFRPFFDLEWIPGAQTEKTNRKEHPNLRPILGAFINPKGAVEAIVLAYEYEARNFLDAFRKADLKIKISLFKQLLSAVQKLHENKIVHNNICNTSILVCRGHLYLLETGLQEKLTPFNPSSTISTRESIFRAPEIEEGKPHNEAADIYALGALLFSAYFNTDEDPKDQLHIVYDQSWRDFFESMLKTNPSKRAPISQLVAQFNQLTK